MRGPPKARLVEKWTDTSPDALAKAIRDFKLPAGESFARAAGEAKVIAAVRTILVEQALIKTIFARPPFGNVVRALITRPSQTRASPHPLSEPTCSRGLD